MTLTIKLFGPQATLAGEREVTIKTPQPSATAGEVLRLLGQVSPALGPSLDASRLAINHEFAADTTVVRPSDEIALIGMVSGG